MHLLAISALLALGADLVEAQTTSVETSKVLIGKALEKERYGLRRGFPGTQHLAPRPIRYLQRRWWRRSTWLVSAV